MEKQRSSRIIAIVALLVAVLGLSIGFAALSTTLSINGTAQMDPSTWQIKFQNLSAPVITGDASVVVAPVLSDTTIQTFSIKLTKPGDSVTYTFDVTNSGTIDALLGTYTKAATPTCTGTGTSATADETLVCNNLVYTLKYTTGGANVGSGDTLPATSGNTKNMTLKIEYPSTATEIPSDVVNITNLGITLLYIQD